jgi:hypothetical protein
MQSIGQSVQVYLLRIVIVSNIWGFTEVKICTEVFWIKTPYCSRIGGYQLFGDTDSSIITLKFETACSTETLVATHQATTRHNTEVRSVITGNLETQITYKFFSKDWGWKVIVKGEREETWKGVVNRGQC